MSKCEWKDGKYIPCKSAFENYIDLGNPYDGLQKVFKREHEVIYCPFCGVDIRRLKEGNHPIAMSGKTWVMDFQDNNYIAIKTQIGENCKKCDLCQDGSCVFEVCPRKFFYWKNFLNIKITDEIALHRPMISMAGNNPILYGVVKNTEYPYLLYFPDNTFGTYRKCRLATAKELLNEM